MTTIAFNLNNGAPTQYLNYEHDSMCFFNGMLLGVGANGIFKLNQGGDDDGADIDAYLKLGTDDLGSSRQKRVRKGYIGYEGGPLEVTVEADEETSFTESVAEIDSGQKQEGNTFPGQRTAKGRYFSVKVANVGGSDFSLDSIEVVPVLLARKPSGSAL